MNHKVGFKNRFRSKLRGIKYLFMLYNSTNKLQFASLLKFESHYPPLRGIVQLTNSAALSFRNWSFNNKQLFQKASMKKKLFPESFLAGKDSTK
jgi:hypothetical protein